MRLLTLIVKMCAREIEENTRQPIAPFSANARGEHHDHDMRAIPQWDDVQRGGGSTRALTIVERTTVARTEKRWILSSFSEQRSSSELGCVLSIDQG
jgi:hypothetical protein